MSETAFNIVIVCLVGSLCGNFFLIMAMWSDYLDARHYKSEMIRYRDMYDGFVDLVDEIRTLASSPKRPRVQK